MQSLTISSRFVKFYEIIKQYRVAVEKHFNKTKDSYRKMNMTNAILQDQKQNKKTIEKNKNKSKFNDYQKKCVCELIHLFENCPHIIKTKQSIDWIKIKKKRENIRKRICLKSINNFKTIKHISNTNILNNLIENSIEKEKNQIKQKFETIAKFLQYHFVNTIYMKINMIKKS